MVSALLVAALAATAVAQCQDSLKVSLQYTSDIYCVGQDPCSGVYFPGKFACPSKGAVAINTGVTLQADSCCSIINDLNAVGCVIPTTSTKCISKNTGPVEPETTQSNQTTTATTTAAPTTATTISPGTTTSPGTTAAPTTTPSNTTTSLSNTTSAPNSTDVTREPSNDITEPPSTAKPSTAAPTTTAKPSSAVQAVASTAFLVLALAMI
ncbi:hypothetical protein AC1031_010714 [Aphanomyces cochlioides]|nr:hypothetical protein AC1031_010714 [Aphanomyces cochlioides]